MSCKINTNSVVQAGGLELGSLTQQPSGAYKSEDVKLSLPFVSRVGSDNLSKYITRENLTVATPVDIALKSRIPIKEANQFVEDLETLYAYNQKNKIVSDLPTLSEASKRFTDGINPLRAIFAYFRSSKEEQEKKKLADEEYVKSFREKYEKVRESLQNSTENKITVDSDKNAFRGFQETFTSSPYASVDCNSAGSYSVQTSDYIPLKNVAFDANMLFGEPGKRSASAKPLGFNVTLTDAGVRAENGTLTFKGKGEAKSSLLSPLIRAIQPEVGSLGNSIPAFTLGYDFDDPSAYLAINPVTGEIAAKTRVGVKNVFIPTVATIKEASALLEYKDGSNTTRISDLDLKGQVSIAALNDITLLTELRLKNWQPDKVYTEASNLNIPLDGSLYLQRVAAGVSNIIDPNRPLTLRGGVGVSLGMAISTNSILGPLKNSGSTVAKTVGEYLSKEIGGLTSIAGAVSDKQGNFSAINTLALAALDGDATINKEAIAGRLKVTLLGLIQAAKAEAILSFKENTMATKGETSLLGLVKTQAFIRQSYPEQVGKGTRLAIGGQIRGGDVSLAVLRNLLPQTDARALLEYSDDGNSGNDYFSFWGKDRLPSGAANPANYVEKAGRWGINKISKAFSGKKVVKSNPPEYINKGFKLFFNGRYESFGADNNSTIPIQIQSLDGSFDAISNGITASIDRQINLGRSGFGLAAVPAPRYLRSAEDDDFEPGADGIELDVIDTPGITLPASIDRNALVSGVSDPEDDDNSDDPATNNASGGLLDPEDDEDVNNLAIAVSEAEDEDVNDDGIVNDTDFVDDDGIGVSYDDEDDDATEIPAAAGSQAIYTVPKADRVRLTVGWSNRSLETPEFEIVAPDGTVYDGDDLRDVAQVSDGQSSLEFAPVAIDEDDSNDYQLVVYLVEPAAGDWTLRMPDTSDLGQLEYSADVLNDSDEPSIELGTPVFDPNTGTVTLPYTAIGTDASTSVRFYYDKDGLGGDGVPISDDIQVAPGETSSQFVWNVKDLPSDEYFLMARISDENSPPTVAYADGDVSLVEAGSLPSVENVGASWIGADEISVTWDSVPGADRYIISYSSNAAGDEEDAIKRVEVSGLYDEIVLSDLIQGETYRVSVQAIDAEDDYSSDSEPTIVTIGDFTSSDSTRDTEESDEWGVFATPGSIYTEDLNLADATEVELLEIPEGAELDLNTGKFTWDVPADLEPGWYDFALKVTDAFGDESIKSFEVYVGSPQEADASDDFYDGGEGNDIFVGDWEDDISEGGNGADAFDGGEGDDLLYGNQGSDSIIGGFGDDEIYGGKGNDVARGGFDDDLISGDLGDDTAYGNQGSDGLSGGLGNDQCYGGQGDDAIDGGGGNDALYGDLGDDVVYGGDGNDTSFGGVGDDDIYGNQGGDRLAGGDGDDTLSGGRGADTLLGESGSDDLYGDRGSDVLDGGDGDDFLKGANTPENSEIDRLTGGEGYDYFSLYGDGEEPLYSGFGNLDYAVVTDFEIDKDTLVLQGTKDSYRFATINPASKLPAGIGVFYRTASGREDLIAILQNSAKPITSPESLQASNFFYADVELLEEV